MLIDRCAARKSIWSSRRRLCGRGRQLWAFMLLVLGVNVIGIMSYFFYERQQRAAFLETRQSIETKLILEQESREQVSSARDD